MVSQLVWFKESCLIQTAPLPPRWILICFNSDHHVWFKLLLVSIVYYSDSILWYFGCKNIIFLYFDSVLLYFDSNFLVYCSVSILDVEI